MLSKGLRRTTIRDIALIDKVHPSIVSRVLTQDPKLSVRPNTRARVLHAAKRLAYQPNGLARGLRLQRTKMLAMLVLDITNPIYGTLIRGAEQAALTHGYNLFVCNTGDNADRELNAIRSVAEKRVDGLLIATARRDDDLMSALATFHLPYVLVNRRAPNARFSVTADDTAGAQLAVEHLTALGHRRIAHITGAPDTDTAQRRLEGYRRGMRAAGLTHEMVVEGGFRYDAGFAAMQRLLQTPPLPTAVFVGNVVAALGALRAAKDARVAVSAEISLVGFHDILAAAQVEPALTTVRMPLDLVVTKRSICSSAFWQTMSRSRGILSLRAPNFWPASPRRHFQPISAPSRLDVGLRATCVKAGGPIGLPCQSHDAKPSGNRLYRETSFVKPPRQRGGLE